MLSIDDLYSPIRIETCIGKHTLVKTLQAQEFFFTLFFGISTIKLLASITEYLKCSLRNHQHYSKKTCGVVITVWTQNYAFGTILLRLENCMPGVLVHKDRHKGLKTVYKLILV